MDLNNDTKINHSDTLKNRVDPLETWFWIRSPYPVLLVMTSYWLFVLKLGPLLMKNRSPFLLNNLMLVYNIFQVVFSLLLFLSGCRFLWTNGLIQTECVMENNDTNHQVVTIIYFYLIAKLTELLDTVFFILRKKYNQASFLHIYHHSVTVICTWILLKYEPNMNATQFLGTINSFVHVVMYAYYALSSYPQLGKYLWWKKYITRLQLVQFLLIILHMTVEYQFTKCKLSYILLGVILGNVSLFVFLFSDFYVKTYNQNKRKGSIFKQIK